jgi:phage tail-like protein
MAVFTTPLHTFRFHVDFRTDSVTSGGASQPVSLCQGAFSDCTGLEATMEPKAIREGGLNYGAHQRAGTVTFSTVILKRGYSTSSDLWKWFQSVNNGAYSQRLAVIINVYDIDGTASLAWQLDRALPIKFKAADLNAKGAEVGIEELHLIYERLSIVTPTLGSLFA